MCVERISLPLTRRGVANYRFEEPLSRRGLGIVDPVRDEKPAPCGLNARRRGWRFSPPGKIPNFATLQARTFPRGTCGGIVA